MEEYIRKYKHLKGIPTTLDIKENGMIMTEIVPKLLEKVEELTLYIIQLKKEIDELKKNQNE